MMGDKPLLLFNPAAPGQIKCELDLNKLFPDFPERERFNDRWIEFLKSNKGSESIFRNKGDKLVYTTEQLIPTKSDDRRPLLLVLGNPASHSVEAGMFFSFEKNGKEHRFWKDILRPAGILDLALDKELPVEKRNTHRRERLLNLKYNSPFRIGLAVFFSLPSPASGPWAGVAGVKKLFGAEAIEKLAAAEQKRIKKCAQQFLSHRGPVIVFQKDAWDFLRSDRNPGYNLEAAKSGGLFGEFRELAEIPIYGIPPTRLSGPAAKVLAGFASKLAHSTA